MKVEDIKFEGSFNDWFLDYSSEVIISRAIPNAYDGLKPVQRRILHTMFLEDDGRFNKVVKTAGAVLQFHPHGDGSVEGALVNMAQKDYLIDKQGAFGNPKTGDYSSAAGRYIEARLSNLAKEIMFSPKVTEWTMNYDNRQKEPIYLPAKFPILLSHGAEGIAVALSCKIFPHNFNEICDAAISYLQNKDFKLYPDFPTGGYLDYSNYNDGLRGGKLICRAKIETLDKRTLVIKEIPFGTSCDSIRDSIVKAVEKGKIKIKHVDDNSSETPEIVVHLNIGEDPEKVKHALYMFTDCQVSLSPNACVIHNGKPEFLSISDILKISVDKTKDTLKKELEVKLEELKSKLHKVAIEKLFIENKVYKELENCESYDEGYQKVKKKIEYYNKQYLKYISIWVDIISGDITDEDIVHLTELKFKKLTKYDQDASDKQIEQLNKDIKSTKEDIQNIVRVTVDWFKYLKNKYGKNYQRRTELCESFQTVSAASVVANNVKLYINRETGIIGTDYKISKDGEFLCDCSDIDDILVICKNGDYGIYKVSDKVFVGENILHACVYKKDEAKNNIYNIVYTEGGTNKNYIKRCTLESLIRNKTYNLCKGSIGSIIHYIRCVDEKQDDKVYAYIVKKRGKATDAYIIRFNDYLVKNKSAGGNMFQGDKVIRKISKEKLKDLECLF